MNKTTIQEEIDAEKDTQPKEVDKDNGTQTFEETKMEKVTAPVVVEGAANMDNSDPTALVYVDYVETPVVVREKRIIDERLNKDNAHDILERYKTSNPKKFEAKKAEFETKFGYTEETKADSKEDAKKETSKAKKGDK